ncbi:hypothetical protein A2400_00790 [candidate division WS6 bacterium RIFOXYB1_FULL_33_14]|uniref:Lipoprotein n=1 Tax=candidate division WS6 bacterium RIFOXYB1_FULL_33_14 TaxID=1817896 RepID=A0A1F4UKI5_9BACT|nr:MAG: hypothetical protein A2400_00790 [candidate division WS6 bacterium RIFOXYB1_FULL_33_14]
MKKNMFLYLLVILLSAVLLSGCTKKEEEVIDETEDTSNEQEEEKEEEVVEETDLGYLSNPDDFKKVKQVLGEDGDYESEIVSIKESSEEGYHEFTFSVLPKEAGASIPYFTVEPMYEKGVIRVTIKNIVSDSTGITHQNGLSVDEGAITGLYRVITSLENTRIYDIGVLANNAFSVDVTDDGDGWIFFVKVAYDTSYKAPTVDYGSTQFSSDEQSIEGMTADEGAKITTYSYSVTGGVLKFVYAVASGASNPIPSVNAKYDDGGMLVVTFQSLDSDKVSTWGSTISLPSGVSALVSRSGETSTYKFGGISGKKQFKLSATQSPNQVIVEITL